MSGHNNFFVQQLLESRGTKLPDLDYLGFGEPTTYGTTFVYSEEVAKSLQHPRIKKGTMNKGSSGMTAAPWAENVVQPEKMASVYGHDFVKSANVAERYNTETLLAKNKEMKAKQRAEALVRQEQLFTESKDAYETFMKGERQRYRNAQDAYNSRTSRIFNHKGIAIRPKLDDVQIFEKELDRRSKMEERIRATVPRHTAQTPQPTLDMLKTVDDSKLIVPLRAKSVAGGEGIFENQLGGFSDPTPMTTTSIASNYVHTKVRKNSNNNNGGEGGEGGVVNTSAISNTSSGGQPHPASQHVYIADKQRIKYMKLEAQRHSKGKEDLLQHGWSEETDPRGPEKNVYLPDEEAVGLDADAMRRVSAAVAKRKMDDINRRTRAEEDRAHAQSQLQQQIVEMSALSRQPGIHRRTQREFEDIMGELLKDSTAQITVPRDLGILTPASEAEIMERAKAVAKKGQFKTSISGAVPLVGGVRVLRRTEGDGDEEVDTNDNSQREPAGVKTSKHNVSFNILSDSPPPAEEDGDDANAVIKHRPMRRTVHTHMPLPISQRTPLNPTRKDIDRELKAVIHGGHLMKDRSAAIKAMGPERVSYIKNLNLSGNNNASRGGNNTTISTSVHSRSVSHGIASVSGGGGGARMAKAMVPPESVGKVSLALL